MKRSHSTQSPRASAGSITCDDVLAARGEHQQRLGVVRHRLTQQRARAAPRRAACRRARASRRRAWPRADSASASQARMRALAGAVDAFERDEAAAGRRGSRGWSLGCRGQLRGLAGREHGQRPPFWYFDTARLCSARFAENSDVPSPRETKYRYGVARRIHHGVERRLRRHRDRRRRQAVAHVGVVRRVGSRSRLRRLPSKRAPMP